MAAQNRLVFLRTVFLATILVGLIAYAAIRWQTPSSEPGVAAPLAVVTGYTAQPLDEAPDLSDPSKLRRPRKYLVPDRRFTGALDRIHAFYTGAPATVTTVYRDDGWDVAVGEAITFRWPEPVDFGDYLNAATTVMEALDATHPVELVPGAVDDAALAEFDKRLGAGHLVPVIDILIEADALWVKGNRDPRLLIYAAEVAGRLMIEADDALRMSDHLDSYALYLTSLERRYRPYKGTGRREIRLAEHFGYDAYARSRADELDDTDPLRATVTGDYGPRNRPIPYAGASPYERFLYERGRMRRIGGDEAVVFRRMLDRRPFDQAVLSGLTGLNWWGTVQEVPPMQASLTGLALTVLLEENELSQSYREMLEKQSADPAVFESHRRRMASELDRYSDPFDRRLWQLVQRFERQEPAGPLADFEAMARVYRSYLLSSIYRVGKHLMDTYSSVEAVSKYLEVIPTSADPELSDYRGWLEAMYHDMRAAPEAPRAVESLLHDPKTLGHYPVMDVYEKFANYDFEFPLSKRQREMFVHVHGLADGRPSFRNAISVYADSFMFDRFRRLEELEALDQLASGDYRDAMTWYAVAIRDVSRIREMASRADLSNTERIEMTRNLATVEGWSDERLVAHLVDEANSAFDTLSCLNEAIRILREAGDDERIVKLGREWLLKGNRPAGIPEANMRVSVAAAHFRLGEYEEAWEVVEPAVPVYTEGSLVWSSRILDKLGETERARELAEASVKRYSDNLASRMALAEWHWNRGDWDAAAKVLTAPGVRVETVNWHNWFNPPIQRAFDDRPAEDLRTAARTLLEAGFSPTTLARAASRLGKDGDSDLALSIYLEVQPVSEQEMWVVPEIYRYMEEAEGIVPARQWWVSTPSRRQHRLASAHFHTKGWHEYLWTLYPPDYTEVDEYHAVLQSAGCALDAEVDEKYGQQLREYLAGAGDGWYHVLSRYLLGDEDDATIAAHMKNPKKLCETSYFLGLIAENEGRITDALQWYLVCIDTGLDRNGEFHWATGRLREFEDRILSPAAAEAEWRIERGIAGD